MKDRAYIIFTREPVPGKTKTRMMPYYTPEQCAALHCCFLKDFKEMSRAVDGDIIVYYASEDGNYPLVREIFGEDVQYYPQSDGDIGIKMHNAITDVLAMGYSSCVLTGTDIPELRAESINYALDNLDNVDAVVGPTADGGYHLIGLKEPCLAPFDLAEYRSSSVCENTVNALKDAGLEVAMVHEYSDIDKPCDAAAYRRRMRADSRLANSSTGRFLAATATVSIIVPVYNEETTIESLQQQLRPYLGQAEIIFADGGSTDRTCELISDEFHLIHTDKGRGRQMNEAAKISTGDILFFLHCDSTIPENLLDEIRSVMRHHSYGCFGVDFRYRHFFMWTNKLISNHRAWKRGLPFGDQGIFIDRELFMEMGMYKELPIMEDLALSADLKEAGYMPGRTRNRIITSSRRYEGGTWNVMKTEYLMWDIRRRYRRGEKIADIAKMYGDKR